MVVQDIFRTIRAINATGVSILLVEQNARHALDTAGRGYVLQTGSIIACGSCATLREDDRVREAYLGVGAARTSNVAKG
jgi:branched-chain amino acid transport system ATP-binding protein